MEVIIFILCILGRKGEVYFKCSNSAFLHSQIDDRKEEMNKNMLEKREAIINPEMIPEKLSVIIKDEDGKLYESTKDNLVGYKLKV